ncbi:MAG: signal peptidase I [Sulfolobales archaeon]
MIRICRLFATTFIVALIALILLMLLWRFIEIPVFIAPVVGYSMVPTIYPGDLLIISRAEPRVGDVVIWCSSALFCVVHRIIEINGSSVVTKGDANLVPDEPISAQAIKGKAIAVIPFGSFILIFIIAAACIAVIRCMGRSR